MKRVTFKVAKVIKEAGYPQDITKEEYLFDVSGNPSTGFEECEEFVRPAYLEVWLWLWQKKKNTYSSRHRLLHIIFSLERQSCIYKLFS